MFFPVIALQEKIAHLCVFISLRLSPYDVPRRIRINVLSMKEGGWKGEAEVRRTMECVLG